MLRAISASLTDVSLSLQLRILDTNLASGSTQDRMCPLTPHQTPRYLAQSVTVKVFHLGTKFDNVSRPSTMLMFKNIITDLSRFKLIPEPLQKDKKIAEAMGPSFVMSLNTKLMSSAAAQQSTAGSSASNQHKRGLITSRKIILDIGHPCLVPHNISNAQSPND